MLFCDQYICSIVLDELKLTMMSEGPKSLNSSQRGLKLPPVGMGGAGGPMGLASGGGAGATAFTFAGSTPGGSAGSAAAVAGARPSATPVAVAGAVPAASEGSSGATAGAVGVAGSPVGSNRVPGVVALRPAVALAAAGVPGNSDKHDMTCDHHPSVGTCIML